MAAELACLREVETKLLIGRDGPPERARAIARRAVRRASSLGEGDSGEFFGKGP